MLQERIKNTYPVVTLPEEFQEENRGFDICCENELVVASNDSNDTWKNDVKSAWIKLASSADTATFTLTDLNDVATAYVCTSVAFVNEDNAYYCTIPWQDVLTSDGTGCYKLTLDYEIGGLTGSLVWGTYELIEYSVEALLGTARLRSIFNLRQEIEGINFTGSNVEDTIRFFGQIRKDQPNMEIEELIYKSRRIETVINENLQSWIMETDPYTDEMLRRFERLYLLSSNELFISDHNAHTNSYRIFDHAVKVSESPERSQPERYARQEIITCKLFDRVKNERTYY